MARRPVPHLLQSRGYNHSVDGLVVHVPGLAYNDIREECHMSLLTQPGMNAYSHLALRPLTPNAFGVKNFSVRRRA